MLRVLTTAKGAVLTVGGLASAVAAVIALVPRSATVSKVAADVSSVWVEPDTSLDQFEDRYASLQLRPSPSPELVDVTIPATTSSTAPATAPETETTTPSQTTTSSGTAATTSTPTTLTETTSSSSSPRSPAARLRVSAAGVARVFPPSTITKVGYYVLHDPTLTATEPLEASLNGAITCPHGLWGAGCPVTGVINRELQRGLSPAAAARRVARMFVDSRGTVVHHTLRPVGATVHFRVELVGFEHERATLAWSLLRGGRGRPLPQEWFRSVIAKQFATDHADDTFDGQFWIPEPRAGGRYIVDLTVVDDRGIQRGEAHSRPFS